MRWDDYILIQTLHDGYHLYDDIMLFDLSNDPHELRNLAGDYPSLVSIGESKLGRWYEAMMVDAQGVEIHCSTSLKRAVHIMCAGRLDDYLVRLRETGRSRWQTNLKKST